MTMSYSCTPVLHLCRTLCHQGKTGAIVLLDVSEGTRRGCSVYCVLRDPHTSRCLAAVDMQDGDAQPMDHTRLSEVLRDVSLRVYGGTSVNFCA